MDCSLHSLGDAQAADAEPSGCIATGKSLSNAAGPLETLLELLLYYEMHEEAEAVCNCLSDNTQNTDMLYNP